MTLKTKSSSEPSSQLDSNLSPVKKTLDEWVQVISEACKRSFDDHLRIGKLILAAESSGLSRSEICELREKRLPLSPSDYSKYKSIAKHDVIKDEEYRERLPTAFSTLYELSLLDPEDLKAGIASGKIKSSMNSRRGRKLSRLVIGPAPSTGGRKGSISSPQGTEGQKCGRAGVHCRDFRHRET